ncbi:nascent polypeptide-associated complex subunit alpha, muscle-specific form-like [Dama dama]|uniref:nascent polypeptide-associated complex subunit alpha, muscle-specific form-like n=1 Tax=Dama dama TaxID=30532 RepID=UPI002A35D4E2|nr:nascent polypeptide-associated complex subunit alpha, muscle-specific form-like [Dama dama]
MVIASALTPGHTPNTGFRTLTCAHRVAWSPLHRQACCPHSPPQSPSLRTSFLKPEPAESSQGSSAEECTRSPGSSPLERSDSVLPVRGRGAQSWLGSPSDPSEAPTKPTTGAFPMGLPGQVRSSGSHTTRAPPESRYPPQKCPTRAPGDPLSAGLTPTDTRLTSSAAPRHPSPRGPPERQARGTPRFWGLDSEGRRGRWPQVTSWNPRARPPSPPAAGLRDPPPETAPGPPRASCFHDNRRSLAWAAQETPRAGPAAPARAPRPGASPPSQPPRPGVPDATERPLPPLLAHPSPPTQPAAAAAAFPRGSHPRRWPEPVSRTRAWRDASCRPPNGRGRAFGGGARWAGPRGGRGGRREDGSASSSCGQPETRSGPREGAGPPRDEPLAQWTRPDSSRSHGANPGTHRSPSRNGLSGHRRDGRLPSDHHHERTRRFKSPSRGQGSPAGRQPGLQQQALLLASVVTIASGLTEQVVNGRPAQRRGMPGGAPQPPLLPSSPTFTPAPPLALPWKCPPNSGAVAEVPECPTGHSAANPSLPRLLGTQ